MFWRFWCYPLTSTEMSVVVWIDCRPCCQTHLLLLWCLTSYCINLLGKERKGWISHRAWLTELKTYKVSPAKTHISPRTSGFKKSHYFLVVNHCRSKKQHAVTFTLKSSPHIEQFSTDQVSKNQDQISHNYHLEQRFPSSWNQWELNVKTDSLVETWENASDQVGIGYTFLGYSLIGWDCGARSK